MNQFAQRLLTWWRKHGRHELPWQHPRTPYRVWLAEVMLQQTQVSTVIPYYQRFLNRFPDLASLASASEDDVLALWSGLGYYSRARNLHRSAQICSQQHAGELPTNPDDLRTLPGVGHSTANAIISQAHNQVLPILDGNVKRVMARHAGITGWPGRSAVQKALWQAASERLPQHDGAAYTQAIMDLGATICTRSTPVCAHCPVSRDCYAYSQQRVAELPERKPKAAIPQRQAVFLLLQDAQHNTLLVKRDGQGIWGGLWCLPEFSDTTTLNQWLIQQGMTNINADCWGRFKHVFTHYKLIAEVWRVRLGPFRSERAKHLVAENPCAWLTLPQALDKGLPQPIRRVLEQTDPADLFSS